MLPMLTLCSKIISIVTTSFELSVQLTPFKVQMHIIFCQMHIHMGTYSTGNHAPRKNNGRDNYFKVDEV